MNNVELNNRIKYIQQMFLQNVCKKHEYIKVELSVGINKPSYSYQCKNCGETLKNCLL